MLSSLFLYEFIPSVNARLLSIKSIMEGGHFADVHFLLGLPSLSKSIPCSSPICQCLVLSQPAIATLHPRTFDGLDRVRVLAQIRDGKAADQAIGYKAQSVIPPLEQSLDRLTIAVIDLAQTALGAQRVAERALGDVVADHSARVLGRLQVVATALDAIEGEVLVSIAFCLSAIVLTLARCRERRCGSRLVS
jgi:hypothetical protein